MTTFRNGRKNKSLDIVIVGGGLVGLLEALYLAKRGHRVRIYEYREDIRKSPSVRGRSINLSLSMRGRTALKGVGLEQQMIREHGIPMIGRYIHKVDGSTYVIPYDTRTNQCIYSVGRNYLNSLLLTESDKYDNVVKYFNHKLIDADLRKGCLTFQKTLSNETVDVRADLIIGADGAYSAVRKAMMKEPLFNYSQKYIEHGYMEFCIPSGEDGEFLMPSHYLHIWPRSNFMLIALPNQNCTWTVTLFMPFAKFSEIYSEDKLLNFFGNHFADVIPLIGKKRLVDNFFAGTAFSLVSVKCRPYNVQDKTLLIGDAAHAVVPFYGQGMNSGFEDCTILDDLFEKHSDNVGKILADFSNMRWKDVFAISDLAMYNYIEMRDLVTRPSYLFRKSVDDFLFWILPDLWVPLYNSVSFTSMPYSQCVRNRKLQDKIFKIIIGFLGLLSFYLVLYLNFP